MDCSPTLLGKFRTGELDWADSKTMEGSPASVYIGLILSGEKLIADGELRDQLVNMEPEAIGGDMEVGLVCSCGRRSQSRLDFGQSNL